MMGHSAILAGADIASNVKSELIDYADPKGLTLLYDNIFFDMVSKSAWRGVPEHASSEETDRAFLENFRSFDDLFLVPKSEAPKRWKILQQIWVPLPKELNTAASREVWTL